MKSRDLGRFQSNQIRNGMRTSLLTASLSIADHVSIEGEP
jgi:hypothetical protein